MYLPDDLHRFLSQEAERQGSSMAAIAREAIGQYRSAQVAQGSGVASLFGVLTDEDPATDLSLHVDDVLGNHYRHTDLGGQGGDDACAD